MDAIIYVALGFILGVIIAAGLIWNGFVKKLKEESQNLTRDLQESHEKIVRLEAEKKASEELLERRAEDEKKLEAYLKNLSNEIFEEKNKKFKEESKESIGQMLNPLKEKLSDFEKKVEDYYGQQRKEQFSLKEQIKNIVDMNEKMSFQTENLTKALKGDSKTQGDWGEVILENILESSGLRKDDDYIVQGKDLGIRNAESGQNQKPDVVINLPDGKHVIIDSKVTLRSYEQFCSETDESQRGAHLVQFLSNVRKRVNELEKKHYQGTDKLGTPEIVLMFMPIEGAFMLALQQDRELHEFAWNKKVAIVCPSTLFATLKTINSLWRLVRQNKNVQEIAKEGGALYDKIEGFVKDMQSLGKQLKTVEGTYDSAMNKLASGRGNILGRTEKLKLLGAKTSKSLPTELIEAEDLSEDEGQLEKKRA